MDKLIGKTIAKAEIKGHLPKEACDSENVLVLTMTDGSIVEIQGGYGGYTGESCGEYVEMIWVMD